MKSAFGKVLTVLFVFFQYSTALHFYLRTGDTRCFYEELQEDTLVVGKIDAYEKNDQGEYFKNGNLRVEITVDVSITSSKPKPVPDVNVTNV